MLDQVKLKQTTLSLNLFNTCQLKNLLFFFYVTDAHMSCIHQINCTVAQAQIAFNNLKWRSNVLVLFINQLKTYIATVCFQFC